MSFNTDQERSVPDRALLPETLATFVYDEFSVHVSFMTSTCGTALMHKKGGGCEESGKIQYLGGREKGINVNITLLFSVPRYETVAWAYIKALERRMVENRPVKNVASVASFFLSRIDVLVDQLLSHLIRPKMRKGTGPYPEALLGRVAIANAKLAYQSFKRIFRGEPWQALECKGARVQRPLWASTSTKNPEYRDIRYVEPLIGPYTVNTMPEETIAAFAGHGMVQSNSVEADLEEAQQVFQNLENLGVNFNCVTWQLENEGVQKFIEPYDMLMDTLNKKRQQLLDAA